MLPAARPLRLPLRPILDLRLTLAFFLRVPPRDRVPSPYAAVEAVEAERLMPPSSRIIGAELPTVLPTRTVLPPSAQVRIWDLMPA
jgi:hypothetical protein